MSIRTTSLVTGEYYHIYNRGNSKQIIFNDDQDYQYFMHLLLVVNTSKRIKGRMKMVQQETNQEDKIVSIGAFCLMPNHFHILVKQEKDSGITVFIQKLLTGYVGYYNKKYKRSGSLFEGRFKSKYVDGDRYLKYLFSYIHLNPLKIIDKNWKSSKLHGEHLDYLVKYQYSSFHEYLNSDFTIVNREAFPDYFSAKNSFLKEITSWLRLGDNL